MSEFSIIDRFCQGIGRQHTATIIGVGDDAAVVNVPEDKHLAVSIDTMVEGVHFLPNTEPADLAHKLLAVNLSDMAAMGATPKWATIALTLPESNDAWLAAFSSSLDKLAKRFGVQLIGGDTTKGKLTLSLNIMGLLPKSKVLTRAGAGVDDAVYVSNHLGDAALALRGIQGNVQLTESQAAALMPALHRPEPQVKLGIGLLGLASACLDISDGLVADLAHIVEQSGVSIAVDVDAVPVSDAYQQYVKGGGNLDLALSGGDNYQLAFTVSRENETAVLDLAEQLQVGVSRIGKVISQTDQAVVLSRGGLPYHLTNASGYEHFR